MFMSLFTRSTVKVFVTSLLCSVLDFWITKNITGRYLVGLRWWTSGELTDDDIIQDKDENNEEEDRPPRQSHDGIALMDLEKKAVQSVEEIAVIPPPIVNPSKAPGEDEIIDLTPKVEVEKPKVEIIEETKTKTEKKLKKEKKVAKKEKTPEPSEDSQEESLTSDSESEEEEEEFQQEWYFESYDYNINNSFVDAHIFWWSQGLSTAFWAIFLVINTLAISIFWVG